MEIIKLTDQNIPSKEVIAIGYQNECLVGYVSGTEEHGFECESEESLLEEVTHFMNIPKKGIDFK